MTDDYLCPNCQTPWKCNGPHIPEATKPSAEPVAESYKQAEGSRNCMQIATAYMLGLPAASVPDFEKGGVDAWEQFEAFFEGRGFTVEMLPPSIEIDGDYLASGCTARGTSHMVVMRGGNLLHDPHPSNAGLLSVQVVWVIARKSGGALYTHAPDDTALLRQALEALTSCTGVLHWPSLMPTIAALRERLGDTK